MVTNYALAKDKGALCKQRTQEGGERWMTVKQCRCKQLKANGEVGQVYNNHKDIMFHCVPQI